MKTPKILKRTCPICRNEEAGDYEIKYESPFEILKCLTCDLSFINGEIDLLPEKIDSSIEHFLKNKYTLMSKAKRDFKDLIRWLNEFEVYRSKEMKILDVGCGLGYFLREARHQGWVPFGLEINKNATKYAQEHYHLDVEAGNVERGYDFPSEFFGVITMFGVIEHLIIPSKAIEECYRLLKPGGILCLQTPTEDGLFRKVGYLLYEISYGKADFQVKQLYSLNGGHNLCFSKRSIRILLERNDFCIKKISNSSYGLKILLKRFNPTTRGVIMVLGTTLLYLLSQAVRKTNHMTVLARKKIC